MRKTYFLLCEQAKLVKIRSSNRPLARVAAIRTMNACPVELLCVLRVEEKDMHERFMSYRMHGEWFRISEEMCHFMEIKGYPAIADKLRLVLKDVQGY